MIDGLMDGFDEAIVKRVGTIEGQREGVSDIEIFEITLGTFDG
jgi:hypothetical protein